MTTPTLNDCLILLNHVVGKSYGGRVVACESTNVTASGKEFIVTFVIPASTMTESWSALNPLVSTLKQTMLNVRPDIVVEQCGYQRLVAQNEFGSRPVHKLGLRLTENYQQHPNDFVNEDEALTESTPMGKPHSKDGSGVRRWEFKMRHKDNSTVHIYDRPKHVRGSDTEPRFLLRHTSAAGHHLGTAFTHTHVEAHKKMRQIEKHGRLLRDVDEG